MKKLLTSVICDEAINMMLVICEKALMFVTYEVAIDVCDRKKAMFVIYEEAIDVCDRKKAMHVTGKRQC